MKSPGLKTEQEFIQAVKNDATLNLSEEDAKSIYFYQERAYTAFRNREQAHEYLDNLTWHEDYVLNRRAANTYLRPKKNDSEVRVNLDTTEKKIEVVYNELLSFDFKTEFRAFDKDDNFISDLGESLSKVVERTCQIENDTEIWKAAYLEGLTQRLVFIEECWESIDVRDKRLQKAGVRRIEMCKKKVVSSLKVFPGDMSIPHYRWDEQPYIVTYDRVHWRRAESIFGNDPWFKYAQKGGESEFNVLHQNFGTLQDDEVEILCYQSYPDDEMMWLVGGVPMKSMSGKLPWEHEGYRIQPFGLKTMSPDFIGCKPLTASVKTLQAFSNETIRLVIRKWRQALEPPLGVKNAKVFSKDIWAPSAVTQGVGAKDFERLIDHDGVTASEFNMLEYIDRKAQEMVGASNLQQGLGTQGDQTATEAQLQQMQFVKQLGLSVLMAMQMHRKMGMLRLYNILENATKPTGKKIDKKSGKLVDAFRQFSLVETDIGNGRNGEVQIEFTNRDLTQAEIEETYEKEKTLKKLGKDKRFYSINVEKLLSIPYIFYPIVSQTVKESDALDKVMFTDALKQAVGVAQIAGRPLAGDAIIEDFGQAWGKKDWFQREAPLQLNPMQQAMQPQQPGQMPGSPANDLVPDRTQRPSLNTLAGAVQ